MASSTRLAASARSLTSQDKSLPLTLDDSWQLSTPAAGQRSRSSQSAPALPIRVLDRLQLLSSEFYWNVLELEV
ncbi:hypothetical protein SRHO_G00204040 [Serrasalmus rhombeus]